ncbi:hypothetical protein KP509_23G055700 [Ceratopteris richardii]|uniref:Uncharacterized protein n=1 Tax=Ceratopteris richardii TaxID=49495 RepID=A0A8T2S289_CERRI|nr:hypothetical protein KP509_23G055700 [Ceratopteris richardii]
MHSIYALVAQCDANSATCILPACFEDHDSPLTEVSGEGDFMTGSLVSARKLAASFWEQYRIQTLDGESSINQTPQLEAQQSCSVPKPLEDTRQLRELPSLKNMASCQSDDFVNVLHRVKSVEEIQSWHTAALQKMKLDMEEVIKQVQGLHFSQTAALKELNSSLQKFVEQTSLFARKEHERTRFIFTQLREEMKDDKDTSRLLRTQNRKLSKELKVASMAAADAREKLERERKARKMLEEVCDELAREIGEDKAEVELLKRQQENSTKRLEEELRAIKMAALWQDEISKKDNPSETKTEMTEGDVKECTTLKENLASESVFGAGFFGPCEPEGGSDMFGKQEGAMDSHNEGKYNWQTIGRVKNRICDGELEDDELLAYPCNGAVSSGVSSSGKDIEYDTSEVAHKNNVKLRHHQDEAFSNGAKHRKSPGAKLQRPRRLRRSMHSRAQQRRKAGGSTSDLWRHREISAWMSSDDEHYQQRRQIANQVFMLPSERDVNDDNNAFRNVTSEKVQNRGDILDQVLSSSLQARSHRRHSAFSQLGSGRRSENSHEFESVDVPAASRSDDEATNCMILRDVPKGKETRLVEGDLRGAGYGGFEASGILNSRPAPSAKTFKPQPSLWSPTPPDTFSSVHGCRIKPSPPQVEQEERRQATASSILNGHVTVLKGSTGKEAANEDSKFVAAARSEGVQDHSNGGNQPPKAAKPSFRFSPLRQRVPHG